MKDDGGLLVDLMLENLDQEKIIAANSAMLGSLLRALVRRGVVTPQDLLEDLSNRRVPEHMPAVAAGVQLAREVVAGMRD